MLAILVILVILNPALGINNSSQLNETVIGVLSKKIIFECPFRSQDENRSLVIWKVGELEIPSKQLSNYQPDTNQRIYGGGNFTLVINKVEYNDANKVYVCQVYGTSKLYDVHFYLIVRGPPLDVFDFNFTKSEDNELTFIWNINVTDSNIVEFYNISLCKRVITKDCEVHTLQHPVYKFTFKNLKPYEEYIGSIFAFNKIGSSKRSDIKARTNAGVPIARSFILDAEGRNRNVSMTIECQFCRDITKMKGELEYFVVNYINEAKENVTIKKHVNATRSKVSITIGRLHPYQNYTFYVSASNGFKNGPADVKKVNTTQDIPNPTTFLRHNKITSTTINILWSPASNAYGPITGYILGYKETSSNDDYNNNIKYKNLTADVHEYLIGDLKIRTPYTIYLAARNKIGRSKFVSTMSKTDRPEPIPPKIIHVIFIESHFVQVQWQNDESIYNSSTELHEHMFIICWSRVLSIYRRLCLRYPLNSDKLHCNHTRMICSINIPINEFDTNETNIYKFNVVVSVPSEQCEATFNCHRLEASSSIVQLKMSEFKLHLKSNGEIDKILLGVLIVGILLIGVFLVCMFLICKNNLKGLCNPHSHNVYYTRPPGEYIEVYPSQMPIAKILPLEKTPHPHISVNNLIEHILNYRADDGAGFQAEFEAIDALENGKWSTSIANYKENLPKNRYTNIFPYDHSRVQLQSPVFGKSDYINANFVDGYNRNNAYIATQGPLKETIGDFWQMIWEQNSEIIVMISNFVERGRCKCEEYWSRKETTFGNISVRLVFEKMMAFYTERRFKIKNVRNKKSGNKERVVYHYQYTDWRDFDVPPSPLPVLVFVRATIHHWSDRSGPIVVHCSAGVGRTGTYICIESQIRQMESEHRVNIRGFLEHIRQQRMKLVQTESQYTFVHDALYEYFICPDHEVHKDDLSTYIKRLKELDPSTGFVKLDIQFKKCIQFEPNDYELMESRNTFNEHKNRSNIVPINSRRINLACEPGIEGSNYINASVVQGYWEMKEYIITQHPLNHTEQDFWKMVWDENCSLIILLSDCPISNDTNNIPTILKPIISDGQIDNKEAGLGDGEILLVKETDNGENLDLVDEIRRREEGDEIRIGNNNSSGNEEEEDDDDIYDYLHRFWPENNSDTRDFRGGMRVSFRSCEPSTNDVMCYEFLLSSSVEDFAQSVRMLHLQKWPQTADECGDLLRILMAVSHSGIRSHTTALTSNKDCCYNDQCYLRSSSSVSFISIPDGMDGHNMCSGTFTSNSPNAVNGVGPSNNSVNIDNIYNLSSNTMSATRTGPTVLVDELGGSRAGIFAATATLLSQLKQDDAVDVYFVVKMLNLERPRLFQDSSDLQFVYELLNYVVEHNPSYSSNILNHRNHHHHHHNHQNHYHSQHTHARDSTLSNGGIFSHLNHNSIFHYATLGTSTSSSNHNSHTNSNKRHHNNSNTKSHKSSPKLSSLSRRRASSVESNSLLNQNNTNNVLPQSNNNPPSHPTSNYGNRTSWNMGESRPGALPLHFSSPITQPNNNTNPNSQQCIQIIANPIIDYDPLEAEERNNIISTNSSSITAPNSIITITSPTNNTDSNDMESII